MIYTGMIYSGKGLQSMKENKDWKTRRKGVRHA